MSDRVKCRPSTRSLTLPVLLLNFRTFALSNNGMASVSIRDAGWSIEDIGQACFAVAAGCFVGCGWWILHRIYFVDLYWHFVPIARASGFVPNGFDGLFAAMNLATAVMQSFSVGFVTGLGSPRNRFYLAFVAMVLTFIGKIPSGVLAFHWTNSNWMSGGKRSVAETWWIACLFVFIYGIGPLYGAFFAQMFKPRPLSVEIQKTANRGRSLSGAIGIGAVISILWKTIFSVCLFSFGWGSIFQPAICMLVAQSITIGFLVTRFAPRKAHGALAVALLMFAIDVALFTTMARGSWPVNTSDYLEIGGLGLLCACATLGSAQLADKG